MESIKKIPSLVEFNNWLHFSETRSSEGFNDIFGRKTYILDGSPNHFHPVVSEKIYEMGFRPEYPEGKKFGVCLSHDIDVLFRRQEQKLKDVARTVLNRNFSETIAKSKGLYNRHIDSEFALENLTNVEDKYGAHSSMYFLSLEPGEEDFNYRVEEIKGVFNMLKEQGHEIGLHGGHKAYNDLSTLKIEKKRLEDAAGLSVKGYRNHFLRFTNPLTWNNLSKTGFEHDSTYGYPDAPGFRNGMCYPFRPYDNSSSSFIDLVEVPLVLMDVSLTRIMRLDLKDAIEYSKMIAQRVKKIGGVFTFLFHNSQDQPELYKFYEQVLAYLDSEGAWLTSTQSMVDWWKSKGYLEEVEKYLIDLRDGENH